MGLSCQMRPPDLLPGLVLLTLANMTRCSGGRPAEAIISIDVQVVENGAGASHRLEFGCLESPFNASEGFCQAHRLADAHCQTLRHYAHNKHEAACGTAGVAFLGTTVSRNHSRLDGAVRPEDASALDARFGGFVMGPSGPPDDQEEQEELRWRLPEDINMRLAQLVIGPWETRGLVAADVEAVLDAESECITIQYIAGGGVYVYSPNQGRFEEKEKWFLYQRRHDAIRLVQRLALEGRLGDRGFEMAFCPRDCPVGGATYNYSGMPPPRGSHEVLPAFGIVSCKGSLNIPLPILSRRSELRDRDWDDVAEVLRRNREAYPWDGRRDAAIFRGAVYGRSCWAGEPQGMVRPQDTIACGRPRLLWMAQDPSNAGRGLDVELGYEPLLHQEKAKLQLQVEGHCGWADRAQYLLHMGAGLLLQETMCKPWYLLLLEPWTHYVPVDYHLGDLMERVEWALDPRRQAAVQRMVGRMHEYADAVLTTRGMLDYAAEVLRRYAACMASSSVSSSRPRPGALPASEYLQRYGHLEHIV